MLWPHVVLDLLANFTAYATDKKKRRIKIIARYQQYEGTKKIVERVVAGHHEYYRGNSVSIVLSFDVHLTPSTLFSGFGSLSGRLSLLSMSVSKYPPPPAALAYSKRTCSGGFRIPRSNADITAFANSLYSHGSSNIGSSHSRQAAAARINGLFLTLLHLAP